MCHELWVSTSIPLLLELRPCSTQILVNEAHFTSQSLGQIPLTKQPTDYSASSDLVTSNVLTFNNKGGKSKQHDHTKKY